MSEEKVALEQFNEQAPAAPKPTGNLVGALPEPQFRTLWISMLSAAMLKTGKGFRVDTPKRRQPKGAAKFRGERRPDKVGTSKLERALLAGAR